MSIENLTSSDYQRLLSADSLTNNRFQQLLGELIALTNVIEDSGVPAFAAKKHQWYFDTATNKYYRNVDGGTTWVALN